LPSFGQDQAVRKRQFDDAVNREREVRWEAGTDIEITGYGWIALQGRAEDRDSLAGLAQAADMAMRMGATEVYHYFIDRENVLHILSGQQVMELFVKGANFVSQIHFSSVIIKAQPQYNIDPADDTLWHPKTVRPTS
jgi:hypothetical protein